MALFVAVHGYQDGLNAEASVLNRPIYELTERTQYLYDLLQQLLGLARTHNLVQR